MSVTNVTHWIGGKEHKTLALKKLVSVSTVSAFHSSDFIFPGDFMLSLDFMILCGLDKAYKNNQYLIYFLLKYMEHK